DALRAMLAAAPLRAEVGERAGKATGAFDLGRGDRAEGLRSLGLLASQIQQVELAVSAAAEMSLPALDADADPDLIRLFRQVVRARQTVERALAQRAMSGGQRLWSYFSTVGTECLLVALATGSLYLLLRPGAPVNASDTWEQNSMFAPNHVTDGQPDTYWLLPDHTTGWVEVQITPPRHVRMVRLLNCF